MFEKIIKEYEEEVIALNDNLADNPEIGCEEYKSSKAIVDLLRKHGIAVEYPFNNMETAFKGTINKGKEKKFALLTEYDALRGMGHACGHCASGSISVLAALVLNSIRDEIDAQIDIIGTPDEEITGGKIYMAKDGVFDQYDTAIMIHMFGKNAVSMPFLALDAYIYKFTGAPAHAAAAPWEGRNALNAVRLTFDALDMMRQHVTDDVRIHGYIKEGGVASNIVPHITEAEICLRAMERTNLDYVVNWAHDIGKAAAMATRTEVEITMLGEQFHDLSQKETGNKILEGLFTDLGRDLTPMSNVPSGSSDAGNVDYVCPVFHPVISIGKNLGPHTQEFADEMKSPGTHKAILDGGEIIVRFLKILSEDSEKLENIKKEHSRNRGKEI